MTQTVDDSLFALILRFAGFNQELSFHPDEFCKKQLQEIETYIEQFQPEERGLQAIKWIERYASEYRKNWNKEVISKEVSEHKCPDCPLQNGTDSGHCEIHDQWVELLQLGFKLICALRIGKPVAKFQICRSCNSAKCSFSRRASLTSLKSIFSPVALMMMFILRPKSRFVSCG